MIKKWLGIHKEIEIGDKSTLNGVLLPDKRCLTKEY